MIEVSREAMERYAERRSRQVRALDDPVEQLRLAISLGVPTGPDDEESRLLYELDAFVGIEPRVPGAQLRLLRPAGGALREVLEGGAARGAFGLAAPARHARARASSRWRTGSGSRW